MIRTIICFCLMALAIAATPAFAQQPNYTPGYEPGAPKEIATLPFRSGAYQVSLFFPSSSPNGDPDWQPWTTVSANFESLYDGAFFVERNEGFPVSKNNLSAGGVNRWAYLATWSFDRFNNTFRAIFHDNIMALADIYEGQMTPGALSLSNLNTSTFNNQGTDGDDQKNRLILRSLKDGAFEITWHTLDASMVKGVDVSEQNWQRAMRMIYTPLAG